MSDTDKKADEGRYEMRGKKVDVSIIKLKKDNYMAWSQSVRDCFFCHKLEVFIEAADAATDATELAEPDDLRTDRRRAAWGKVTASLSTTDRQKTAKVKTGHVEMLLFKIRSLYHRKSLAATQSLRRKLMNLRVDDLSEMFLETTPSACSPEWASRSRMKHNCPTSLQASPASSTIASRLYWWIDERQRTSTTSGPSCSTTKPIS